MTCAVYGPLKVYSKNVFIFLSKFACVAMHSKESFIFFKSLSTEQIAVVTD